MTEHDETPDESAYDTFEDDQPEVEDALNVPDEPENAEFDTATDEVPDDELEIEPSVDDRSSVEDVEVLEVEADTEAEEAYEDLDQYADDLDLRFSESDLDFAGALAQVSTLSDVIAEQEAREAEEQDLAEAKQRSQEDIEAPQRLSYFPSPPQLTLERGQLASVIPALVLIILGSYLTFILTSSDDTTFRSDILLYSGASAVGIALLAYWLSTGRWMHGALFSGLSVLLTVGTTYALSQTDDPGWRGWPLLVSAVGLAALLSALLSAQLRMRQAFAGILLIIAGLIGAVVTTDTLGKDVTDLAERAGPVILVAIILLVTVPGLFRFRR
jgi:hypothetical protein